MQAFYGSQVRRLLPAASLTLVMVAVAAYLFMPVSTWATIAADMAASTLYVENWLLVRRSVDYLAQDQAPSPLQHFWSLAVEEQFYLGWPLVLVAISAWWRRRWNTMNRSSAKNGLPAPPPPPPSVYAVAMATPCALSIASALYYARADPAAGYFMTQNRLYELGLGGLLSVWAATGKPDVGSMKPFVQVRKAFHGQFNRF